MTDQAETPLNNRQLMFCHEYLIDLNAKQAAIRAGYSEHTAKQMGSENLSKPYILEKITELKAERANRLQVESDDVLRILMAIMYGKIPDLDAQGKPAGVKARDRHSGAVSVGKHIGFFEKDNHLVHELKDTTWTFIHEDVDRDENGKPLPHTYPDDDED